MHLIPSEKITGFTVMEFSAALVVIALIIAGIMGGKTLMHSAKMQSVVTEVQSLQTVIKGFKVKYNAWPGDLREAYTYWGTDCGQNNVVAQTNPGANPPYCNGNKDGKVGPWIAQAEAVMSWRHLYLADFLPHAFTGRTDTSGGTQNVASIGVNAPAGPIDNSGFHLTTNVWTASPTNHAFRKTGLHLMFGRRSTNWFDAAVVTPTEAYEIDKRMDDGFADGGNVRGFIAYIPPSTESSDCTGGVDPRFNTSGSYALTNPNEVCTLLFFLE